MTEVVLLAQADSDIQSAYNHLEDFQPGRGELFLRKLDGALGLIRTHPFLGPKVGTTVRRILIPGFPHGVFYQVHGNRVFVASIKDLRQDPRTIRRELGLE